ncbi:MAG TPA: hypothetical protein PKI78_05355, partial [Anaerolineales bacterium]|nr:hypothetical protein [Anaerolineales bacterium]
MTYRRFKHEALLYSLAFLVAVGMRFIQLGAMPLTDAEAAPALQALHISQSAPTPLDPHPFYILSTSLAFLLYGGGTNFLARFFPALVGSFLVLAPLLFDGRIKPRPGLLLAFFIALDPGLIAISRQAASPIFAIAFFVLTLGFLNRNNLSLAAFFAALTLLSGPSVWLGVLGFGIAWAIFQLFNRRVPSADEQSSEGEKVSAESEARPFTVNIQPAIWILFAASFLAAGTLFLTVPDGLGAAFASIPAFVGKWTQGSNLTPLIVAMSLVIYQPLALLLAVIASIRGWVKGSPRIIFLSVWLLVSLLLVVFLPARQMSDLVWTLIPMLILAALEFARHFNIYADERREVLGVIFLTAFIWAFAWLGFAGLTWFPPESREYLIRFWMLIGSLVLLVLSLLLVAAGWSTRTARIGGVWG